MPRRTSSAGINSTSISFSAMLLRPAATARPVSWTFLPLPKEASAKLPSRGQVTVEGTFNGAPFPSHA